MSSRCRYSCKRRQLSRKRNENQHQRRMKLFDDWDWLSGSKTEQHWSINASECRHSYSRAKQSKVLPYIQQCIAKAFYLSSQIALIMWAKNPFIKSIALISSAAARNVLHIENHTKLNPAMKMIALRVQRHQRLTTMWSFALVQTCFMQNISIENSCNKRCAHTT